MFGIECKRVLLEWRVHVAEEKKGSLSQGLRIPDCILFWILFHKQEKEKLVAFFFILKTMNQSDDSIHDERE